MDAQPSPGRDPDRPLPRIGDAERDKAVTYLQEHMAQGRLDQSEFEERLNEALRAKTEADLDPLFHDLPEPRPATGLARIEQPTAWTAATAKPAPGAGSTAATPVPAEGEEVETYTPRWAAITLSAIWPVAILINVIWGFGDNWWAWIVGGVLSWFITQNFTGLPKRPDGPRAVGH